METASKHLDFLEDLIRSSQESAELLTDMYFRLVSDSHTLSDEELLENLQNISNNLTEMQAKINHGLKTTKCHK